MKNWMIGRKEWIKPKYAWGINASVSNYCTSEKQIVSYCLNFRCCCIYGQFITKQLFIGIRRGEGATAQVNDDRISIWDRMIRIGK